MPRTECSNTAEETIVINGETVVIRRSPPVMGVKPLTDGCLFDLVSKDGTEVPLNIVGICGKCRRYVDIDNGKRERD